MSPPNIIHLQTEALELLDWDEDELKFAVNSAISLFEEASEDLEPAKARVFVFNKLCESYGKEATAAVMNLVMVMSARVDNTPEA